MKKNNLRVVSLATALLIAVQTGVFAFGGTYPEHPEYGGMTESGNEVIMSFSKSSEDHMFTVDGKKFLLLDTDEEGNYFVLTEDLYGKHIYDGSYPNKPVIEKVTISGGKPSFEKGAAFDVDDSLWVFSNHDDDPDNIGYWLNHEFLTDGNGTGNILPQPIQENLVEKTWQVEGMKPVRGWTSNNYFDDYFKISHANEFVASRVYPATTVDAKVALMSYTEYKQYRHLIGFNHNEDVWRGQMLRTPHAMSSAGTTKKDSSGNTYAETIVYTWGGGMVKNNGQGKTMVSCVNDTPATANMFVRPVFWLDKDFFKNVAIEIGTAGEIPMAEVKKLSLSDLMNAYSLEEIAEIYGDSEESPKIENFKVIGTAATGSVMFADYDFIPYNGSAESESMICWMSADSADGDFILTDITGNKFTVTDEYIGKYIKCFIIPKDKTGKTGTIYISNTFTPIDENIGVNITDVNINENKLYAKISNTKTESVKIRIISALYDADNQLVSVNSVSVDVSAGSDAEGEIVIADAGAGQTVSTMIWADNNQPLFALSK